MTPTDIDHLADDAQVVITGADAKRLIYMARMLRSGLAPRDDMTQVWGLNLINILKDAQEI